MVAAMADDIDTQRLIGDLAREAWSVDHTAGIARVKLADQVTTGGISWPASQAGSSRS
jgi:hypothetical protein